MHVNLLVLTIRMLSSDSSSWYMPTPAACYHHGGVTHREVLESAHARDQLVLARLPWEFPDRDKARYKGHNSCSHMRIVDSLSV